MSAVNLSPSGLAISSAVASRPKAGISSADLRPPSLSSERLQIQARRDVAIERFVHRNGLVCNGDIEILIQQEAQSLVANGLFQSKDEARWAIFNAYKRYVRQKPKEEVAKSLEALQNPQTAKALVKERIEKEVRNARQKWLGVHKELHARFGVDATEPKWKKNAELIALDLGHNDAYNLRGLLKEEQTALEQLQAAERRRDEFNAGSKDFDGQVAQAARDLKAFEMFLRLCRGDFKRQIFVNNRILALRSTYQDFDDMDRTFGHSGTLGRAKADLDLAYILEAEYMKRLLDFFGPVKGQILVNFATSPGSAERQIPEHLLRLLETPKAREHYDFFVKAAENVKCLKDVCSRLEQGNKQIKLEQQQIRALLGPWLNSPECIERQASTLEKYVDLEDEAAVVQFLTNTEDEMSLAEEARDDVSESLYDLVVAMAMMQVAESEFLEGLKDKEPTKEDVEVFAALKKRMEEASQEKQRLLKEFASLDADIAEKEKIVATGHHFMIPGYRTRDDLRLKLQEINMARSLVLKLKGHKGQAGALFDWEKEHLLLVKSVIEKTAKLMGYHDPKIFFQDLQQPHQRELRECFDMQLTIAAEVLEAQIKALS